MNADDRAALRTLIEQGRQAALGTLAAGAPFVSMVLYALQQRNGRPPALLIHVSRLAPHTQHLQADPRTSLLVMQPDTGEGDPQALPRVTLQCAAAPVAADHQDYIELRGAYLARLPQQEYLFSFPDFILFRLEPTEARFIGGFAKAFSLDLSHLAEVFAER